MSTAGTAQHAPEEVRRLPLLYHGQRVGALVVAPRTAGARFSAADERLLRDLARHAAVAVRAGALTADLRRSRERIVSAREEERRRLRRDLHDGLGPALAAIAVRADAARPAVDEDPDVAREALEQIGQEARSALADVRRLVHDLRPPALDELGLARALAAQAQRFVPAVRVEVDAPDLGPLPAAVEVATYRIVGEALANVVRHASAAGATVRVRRAMDGDGEALELEVVDDGRGIGSRAADSEPGVGLASMRERAAELGGTCEIAPRPEGGTRVRARLPLPAPSSSGTQEEVVRA